MLGALLPLSDRRDDHCVGAGAGGDARLSPEVMPEDDGGGGKEEEPDGTVRASDVYAKFQVKCGDVILRRRGAIKTRLGIMA